MQDCQGASRDQKWDRADRLQERIVPLQDNVVFRDGGRHARQTGDQQRCRAQPSSMPTLVRTFLRHIRLLVYVESRGAPFPCPERTSGRVPEQWCPAGGRRDVCRPEPRAQPHDAVRAAGRDAGAWPGATAGERSVRPLRRWAAPGGGCVVTLSPLPRREHHGCARGGRHRTTPRGPCRPPALPQRCTGGRSARRGRAGRARIPWRGDLRRSWRRSARDITGPWQRRRRVAAGSASVWVPTTSPPRTHWPGPPQRCGRREASERCGWWESPLSWSNALRMPWL